MSTFSSIVSDLTNDEDIYLDIYKRTKIPIQSVQLTGTSLTQIITHCTSAAQSKFGQLFGLGLDGVLEVTYAMPLTGGEDEIEYAAEMRAYLNEIGVDDNVVGLYCVGSFGEFFDRKFLRNLYRLQAENPNSVAIVYDPVLALEGDLSLCAYRLTDSFFEYLGSKNRGPDFAFDQTLESLPVQVKTTGYENCVLGVMRGDHRTETEKYFEDQKILEASLEKLIYVSSTVQREDSTRASYEKKVNDLSKRQEELIQRRKAENITRRKEGQNPLPETKDILAREFPQLFKQPTGKPDVFTSLLSRYQMSNITDVLEKTQ